MKTHCLLVGEQLIIESYHNPQLMAAAYSISSTSSISWLEDSWNLDSLAPSTAAGWRSAVTSTDYLCFQQLAG